LIGKWLVKRLLRKQGWAVCHTCDDSIVHISSDNGLCAPCEQEFYKEQQRQYHLNQEAYQ